MNTNYPPVSGSLLYLSRTMNFSPTFVLPVLLLLAACTIPHKLPETPTQPAPLPYPEADLSSQVEQLSVQIHQLQGHIQKLQTRVQQLEQRPTIKYNNPHKNHINQPNHTPHTKSATQRLQQARLLYQQKRHDEILTLLRDADGGGQGSETDRESMYLLLQSHVQLGNCQSVINIGQRYAQRYASSTQAADALYHVGDCQWRIQQQDIARDTWRTLLRLYPNAHIAHQVNKRLNHK